MSEWQGDNASSLRILGTSALLQTFKPLFDKAADEIETLRARLLEQTQDDELVDRLRSDLSAMLRDFDRLRASLAAAEDRIEAAEERANHADSVAYAAERELNEARLELSEPDDITVRIRRRYLTPPDPPGLEIFAEAADEIETLRASLAETYETLFAAQAAAIKEGLRAAEFERERDEARSRIAALEEGLRNINCRLSNENRTFDELMRDASWAADDARALLATDKPATVAELPPPPDPTKEVGGLARPYPPFNWNATAEVSEDRK